MKKNHSSGGAKGTNKSFGLTIGIILLITGIWLFNKRNLVGGLLITLGILFIALALLNPGKLEIINELWFKLGEFLNRLFQPILMAVLFFMIFTPYGLLIRIMKGNYLNIKINKSKSTYWMAKDNVKINMKNQF